VQCYVAPPSSSKVTRPPKELKAYEKVWLDPAESANVELVLDSRAFAFWDPTAASGRGRGGDWNVTPGSYELHVGRSSADVAHVVSVER